MNPERFITEHNIDRYEQSGLLDTDWLLSWSPDVERALARLPESIRECAIYRNDEPDAWYEFNLSRSRTSRGHAAGSRLRDVMGFVDPPRDGRASAWLIPWPSG